MSNLGNSPSPRAAACRHDSNGSPAARSHALDAIAVLISSGGGTFSLLPRYGRAAGFERLFGTSHGIDARHAAVLHGAAWQAPPLAAVPARAPGVA